MANQVNKILKVRIIKSHNIAILDLANGKSIVRNQKQFLIDLEESGLIVNAEMITSLANPMIAQLKTSLIGGTVFGDYEFHKAGDKWVVNENSRCVTDANHPLFGKAQVGDELISDKDSTSVEGFLTIQRSPMIQQMYINADAMAQASLAMQGMFDNLLPASNTIEIEAPIEEEIPIDTIAETIGTETTEEKPAKKK